MTEPAPSVKCPRCQVVIPTDKLNPPLPEVRCSDHRCPLNSAETNKWLKDGLERSIGP